MDRKIITDAVGVVYTIAVLAGMLCVVVPLVIVLSIVDKVIK